MGMNEPFNEDQKRVKDYMAEHHGHADWVSEDSGSYASLKEDGTLVVTQPKMFGGEIGVMTDVYQRKANP